MCGLYGFAFIGDKLSSNKSAQITARNAVSKLAILNQDRGTHSTGIAQIGSNGKVRIYKKAVPALDLVFKTKWLDSCTPSEKSPIIMGHTRFATHGGRNEKNSHPFVFGNIVGTHNGIISGLNIFDVPKEIEVDSAQFFWAISKLGFAEVISKVYGSINTVFVDLNDPTKVHFTKINNDLNIILNKKQGWLAWSSDKHHLVKGIHSLVDNEKNCKLIDFGTGMKDYHVVIDTVTGDCSREEVEVGKAAIMNYSRSGFFQCGFRGTGGFSRADGLNAPAVQKSLTSTPPKLLGEPGFLAEIKPDTRSIRDQISGLTRSPYKAEMRENGETITECEGEMIVDGKLASRVIITKDDMKYDKWLEERDFFCRYLGYGEAIYVKSENNPPQKVEPELGFDPDKDYDEDGVEIRDDEIEWSDRWTEMRDGKYEVLDEDLQEEETISLEELKLFQQLSDEDKQELINSGDIKIGYQTDGGDKSFILCEGNFIKVNSINSAKSIISAEDTDRYVIFVRSNDLNKIQSLEDIYIPDIEVLKTLDPETTLVVKDNYVNHCSTCFGAFGCDVPMFLATRSKEEKLETNLLICPVCFELMEKIEQEKMSLKEA